MRTAIAYRTRLTKQVHEMYLEDTTFYALGAPSRPYFRTGAYSSDFAQETSTTESRMPISSLPLISTSSPTLSPRSSASSFIKLLGS